MNLNPYQRKNKYNARKVKFDGHTFDSKAEYNRYMELRYSKQERGTISDLEVHPRFKLQPAFTDSQGKRHRAIYYEGDFAYTEADTGQRIVEDVKGGKATQTATFRLKEKMFWYKYGGTHVLRVVER